MKLSKTMIHLALLLSLTLSSCATIVSGSHQRIKISSNPSQANIYIDGRYTGLTPMNLKLPRNQEHILRIELEGYHSYETVFTKELNGWVFGNIFLGGFFGLAIDAISGAVYKLTPEQVHTNLCQASMFSSNDKEHTYITIVLEADPSWEKVAELQKI